MPGGLKCDRDGMADTSERVLEQAGPAAQPAPTAHAPGPSAFSHASVLALQRSAGNAAVARAIQRGELGRSGAYTPASVTRSSELWWLNGVRNRDSMPTEIELRADAPSVGRSAWEVVEGAERVALTPPSSPGAAARVASRSASDGEDDVQIRVSQYSEDGTLLSSGASQLGVRTPAGTRSVGSVTVPAATPVGEEGNAPGTGLEARDDNGEIAGGQAADGQAGGGQAAAGSADAAAAPDAAPKSLTHKGTTHNTSASWGYLTLETYEVVDDKGKPIKGFDVNEKWPGAVTNDDASTDWRRGPAGGTHSGGTTFQDNIGGEASGRKPAPQAPGSPLGTHKINHWDQEWRIGSTTPGTGVLVQTNVLQKYQDHAEHSGIKSPP